MGIFHGELLVITSGYIKSSSLLYSVVILLVILLVLTSIYYMLVITRGDFPVVYKNPNFSHILLDF